MNSIKKRETLQSQAVNEVRNAIVSGQLQPGSKIIETQISSVLGISRGPLREAIRQLGEEGLIKIIPYQGAFVKSVTSKDIEEIFSFRTNLESFAFQLAWDMRNNRFFEELNKRHTNLLVAIHNNDPQQAIVAELEFHGWVYEFAEHSLLLNTWHGLRSRLHLYFTLHQRAHGRVANEDAHVEYVNQAQGAELKNILQEIEVHMQLGLDKVRKLVEELNLNDPS